MENYLKIGYEFIDGRMYLDLGTNKESIDYMEALSVISGALSMVIRIAGDKGNDAEGEVFRHVIKYLEQEFISVDSFKDLKVKRRDKKG
jgi:hypothetical protein